MNDFYWLNSALLAVSMTHFTEHIDNMLVICSKEKKKDDFFWYNSTIYEQETGLGTIVTLFFVSSPEEYRQIIIPKILQTFKVHDFPCTTIDDLKTLFPDSDSAFLGLDFSQTQIDAGFQIFDLETFIGFKEKCAERAGLSGFWNAREVHFPHLILCDCVQEQVVKLGNGKYIQQILVKLKELDKVARDWKKGNFNYKTVQLRYPLVISPESLGTLSSYSNERTFGLPDGRKLLFDFHIKASDIRIHFFPDDEMKKIFVGYVGLHLPTITDK